MTRQGVEGWGGTDPDRAGGWGGGGGQILTYTLKFHQLNTKLRSDSLGPTMITVRLRSK